MNKDILEKVVKESKSYREVARKTGINPPTIKRLCNNFKLDCTHFTWNTGYNSCINKKFNNLIVQSIERDGKRYFATCKCDCGNIKKTRIDHVINNRIISCGCKTHDRWNTVGNKNHAFTGVGQIGSRLFNEIKRSAERRDLTFNVTIQYISDIFEKQNHKCALSGLPLTFGRIRKAHERSASLDRIDNTKGYIEGNLRWVLKDINMIRRNYANEYFIQLCNMVAKHNPRNLE